MARERMVTRTVMVTEVEVMCLNVSNAQVEVNTYELSGVFTDEKTMLKSLKKAYIGILTSLSYL